jgi:hypothetical protein
MKIPFSRIKEISLALYGKNPNYQFKHFSFAIGRGGRIVAIGMNNQFKTHPIAQKFNQFSNNLHSEMALFLRLSEPDCSNYILVNSRVTRCFSMGCSFPCSACKSLLKQANFREVWATNKFGDFERVF